ncbi:hypothetical protein [Ralstonia wenshanensis]|uniref:HIT domain-containing protein n=1 Tax=Ralstonia wenshanensis TaxID=2842456 RepID=A0AAD2AWI9_9RALS|nr:hypothetical protein [Ralstonia wenshanensis]CAJ0693299.1 hypothetical protein LMG18091_01758 [Ralstonia wenshanensis]
MTDQTDSHFVTAELERTDCFLCRPAARLLADIDNDFFTMAGLGPLSPCYAIIATIRHLDQLGDVSAIDNFSHYVERIRHTLTERFGSCRLTEHGHSPLCTLANSQTVHCFHPHVLLFPGAPAIQTSANQHFLSGGVVFDSLAEALKYGRDLDQYLLVSDTPTSFSVYSAAGGLPRQFARALIAEQIGDIERASWRDFPGIATAEENAEFLRALIRGDS